jgi:hypothetical protein
MSFSSYSEAALNKGCLAASANRLRMLEFMEVKLEELFYAEFDEQRRKRVIVKRFGMK